ncbi:MAG: PH domain-containing protein [Acidobacteriota bacterium]
MASTSVNIGEFGSDPVGSEKALLTARPDIRFLKLSFFAPAVVLVAGIIAYLLPLAIDRDFQLAGSAFMIGIGLVGMACLLALYEGLSKAVYRLTDEHIEEEYGIIHKRVRQIPLSYIRDVTYDQNFLQALFGVSSITVSPTNGDKIVLSNIAGGQRTREIIWKLVLSRTPGDRSSG